MSNLITTQINQLAVSFDLPQSEELYNVLKATAFKGDVTDAQLSALLIVANQYGLNPWTKEIYAFPDKGAIVPVVGVDGWTRIINSNPMFDGMDFVQDAESCTCIIYRKDRGHPIKVTEWLSECIRIPAPGKPNGPWQSHPKRMLRHKSMIQCARLTFGFGGIYDSDEAERIIENSRAAPPKNMGNAEVIVPEADDELITEASVAAARGMAAYQAFWQATGAGNRKSLANHHENFKAAAVAADKERTVSPPPPADAGRPEVTYASVLEKMLKAANMDALGVAADWIGEVNNPGQRAELSNKYEELATSLSE
jgi:phage recombination protein Bet